MESKTSKARWIYTTAELYGVSVGNIRFILNRCKTIYGNRLDFEKQKDYVRGSLNKIAPMKYFQFTGKIYAGGALDDSDWLEYIPNWFREYYETSPYCMFHEPGDMYIAEDESVQVEYPVIEFINDFFQTRSTKVHAGDYVVCIDGIEVKPVPKNIFELTYKKDEEGLYQYLKHGILMFIEEE